MGSRVTLTREQLYEMVWTEPMRVIAPRYRLSDAGLAKICRRMKIPLPGRGYWRQVEVGKQKDRPTLPPLPEGSKGSLTKVTLTLRVPRVYDPGAPVIAQELYEGRPERLINVADTLTRPHPLVRHARSVLHRADKDQRGVLGSWKEKYLDIHVTKESLDRALRIMDALIKGLEERGYLVEVTAAERSETRVRIGEDDVAIRLEERIRRTKRKPEPGRSWAWPAYDYHPTGELTFRVTNGVYGERGRKSWSDGKRQHLEDCLNGIVVGLVAASEGLKERRRSWERQRHEAAERERLRLEGQREEEREKAKVQKLEQDAAAWVRASQIRAYVAAVYEQAERAGGVEPASELELWLRWASGYADRIDPLVEGNRGLSST